MSKDAFHLAMDWSCGVRTAFTDSSWFLLFLLFWIRCCCYLQYNMWMWWVINVSKYYTINGTHINDNQNYVVRIEMKPMKGIFMFSAFGPVFPGLIFPVAWNLPVLWRGAHLLWLHFAQHIPPRRMLFMLGRWNHLRYD